MWDNAIQLIQKAITLNTYRYNPNGFSTWNNHNIQPIPVFLPGESSWTEEPGRPWGCKELNTTE